MRRPVHEHFYGRWLLPVATPCVAAWVVGRVRHRRYKLTCSDAKIETAAFCVSIVARSPSLYTRSDVVQKTAVQAPKQKSLLASAIDASRAITIDAGPI